MPASTRTAEAILRRLEWTVLRRLDGLLQGNYRSLFRGAGVELANVREYGDGDDVRYIDWNVTARLQMLHVREYEEDRELTAWFLLDVSPSVNFGSDKVSKRRVLAEFVAVMARLLTGKGNHCGAVLFSGAVERIVPPRGGRGHVLHLLDLLASRPRLARAPATDLAPILRQAAHIIRRRSLVFVVSDFVSRSGWDQALGDLAHRHEVVAIRLLDPFEARIPNIGLFTFQDSETGERIWVDTSDRAFRRRFATAAKDQQETLQATFAQAGVDCLELSTDTDLLDAVMRFAQLRKYRSGSGMGGASRTRWVPRQ